MDVLFEANPTWLIGPGSRKKIAQIIADREEAENVARHEDMALKATAVGVENAGGY